MKINKYQALELFNIFKKIRESEYSSSDERVKATRNFIAIIQIKREFEELKNILSESFREKFKDLIIKIELEKDQNIRTELINQLQKQECLYVDSDEGFNDFLFTEIDVNICSFKFSIEILSNYQLFRENDIMIMNDLNLIDLTPKTQ